MIPVRQIGLRVQVATASSVAPRRRSDFLLEPWVLQEAASAALAVGERLPAKEKVSLVKNSIHCVS
jgi:hypothetical protein